MKTLAVGDRVCCHDRGGTIRKVMKHTARVRYDDSEEEETENLTSLTPETAKDIARREYESALKAWMLSRPRTQRATIQLAPRFRGPPKMSGVLVSAQAPAEMRQAADELRLLADWFEQQPKEP